MKTLKTWRQILRNGLWCARRQTLRTAVKNKHCETVSSYLEGPSFNSRHNGRLSCIWMKLYWFSPLTHSLTPAHVCNTSLDRLLSHPIRCIIQDPLTQRCSPDKMHLPTNQPTNQPTNPWSRDLLEKLIVTQLVKFPAFYGTRRFVTQLNKATKVTMSQFGICKQKRCWLTLLLNDFE
jgi:hypothetical protein